MKIRFQFQPRKAIQAMAFLLLRLGPTDKVKLMKLLYLADKEHFLRHGLSITGDKQSAMPYGPVPSNSLKLVNGDPSFPADETFKHLHVDDNKVSIRNHPEVDLLTESEQGVLESIVTTHGHKKSWDLVRETHALREYTDSYVQGTSRPITYEAIARHGGFESRFRFNRPVISSSTARQMRCPFGPVDDDL